MNSLSNQMDDKQKSLESHNELPALHELPFIKWIAALSLLSAFLWGIFYETEKITTFYPVGTIPFVHYLAVIAYMMGSLVAASISGSLLLKAWKASCWSESERNMFYGSLSVGGIFFVTGLEFLEVELLEMYHPLFFFITKISLIILMIRYILRILRSERQRSDR